MHTHIHNDDNNNKIYVCIYIYLIVGEGDLNADVFVENTRRCQLCYKAQHQHLQGKQSNNLMYKSILSHQKKKTYGSIRSPNC